MAFTSVLLIIGCVLSTLSRAQIVFPGSTFDFPEEPTRVEFGRLVRNCVTNELTAGICLPLTQCLAVYTQLTALIQQKPCLLGGNVFGICCPDSLSGTGNGLMDDGTIHFVGPQDIPVPVLSPDDFQRAATAAKRVIDSRIIFVEELFDQNLIVQPGTSVKFHLDLFKTSRETLLVGENAIKNLEASIQLVNQNQLTAEQGRFTLKELKPQKFTAICPSVAKCSSTSSIYRTVDGSCNNIEHTDWGKADTALERIIPPKYGDGVNSPRLSENESALPSARLVSQSLTEVSQRSNQSENWTLLLMQWGQFLDHDLTHSPLVRGQNASGVLCCRNGEVIDERLRHPDCFPIIIPEEDVFYSQFNQRCMEFVRSLPAIRPQCNFGPREQLNQVTAFLDGSAVYGSRADEAHELREFGAGRLSMQTTRRGSQLLPVKADECSDVLRQHFCFRAGDGRVNEQPQLAAMHTVWAREHNRIVEQLAGINPGWDDERLFQEARRIVGAEMQHITFKEFLPILLGETYMSKFQLNPKAALSDFESSESSSSVYTRLYDANINPSVTNEFATAAFRMGHSLVQDIIEGYTAFGGQTHSLQLHQHQFKPFELYENNGVDSLLRGLLMQPAQKMDRAFGSEIKNRLFQDKSGFGMDLIALNIQRGRDHGLPPYNDYRALCGRGRAGQWSDLADIIKADVVDAMEEIYEHIDDVDLFIGGMSESRVEGALLGPTFLCLIGDQMARLRRGDRFFYEEETAAFSPQQLNSIRRVSMARILCDNGDDIQSIQPLAFLRSDIRNRRVPCQGSEIPSLDLQHWRQ